MKQFLFPFFYLVVPLLFLNSAKGANIFKTFGELSKFPEREIYFFKTDSSILDTTAYKKKWGIGLSGGSIGAGIDFFYKFNKHFALRGGFNYFAFKLNNYKFSITSTATDGTKSLQTVQTNLDFDMNHGFALFEYNIGSKGWFRFVTGVAFYPTKSAIASAKLITSVKFNDVTISGDDLGSGGGELYLKNKLSPYFGIGLGRLAPRKRVNISADIGTYYSGDYDIRNVVINPGLLLEGNKDNAPILARNLNADWRNKLYPVINLRLAIRLNKLN